MNLKEFFHTIKILLHLSFVDADIPYSSDLINIYGTITSDEFPEIEYIQLGDSLCTDFF